MKTYIIFRVTFKDDREPLSVCYVGSSSKYLTRQSNVLWNALIPYDNWQEAGVHVRALPQGDVLPTQTEAIKNLQKHLEVSA